MSESGSSIGEGDSPHREYPSYRLFVSSLSLLCVVLSVAVVVLLLSDRSALAALSNDRAEMKMRWSNVAESMYSESGNQKSGGSGGESGYVESGYHGEKSGGHGGYGESGYHPVAGGGTSSDIVALRAEMKRLQGVVDAQALEIASMQAELGAVEEQVGAVEAQVEAQVGAGALGERGVEDGPTLGAIVHDNALLELPSGDYLVGGTGILACYTRQGDKCDGWADHVKVDGIVLSLALDSVNFVETKVLVGGDFLELNGVPLTNIGLVFADTGVVDESYAAPTNLPPSNAAYVHSDGRYVVGGVGGVAVTIIGPDGSQTNPYTFIEFLGQPVVTVLVGDEFGGVMVGGFLPVSGSGFTPVRRLDADLVPDPNVFFDSFSALVHDITPRANGGYYLAGEFDRVGGATSPAITILVPIDNVPTGWHTLNFNSGLSSTDIVRSIVEMDGGFPLVGGDFTSPAAHLAMYNINGGLEVNFHADDSVRGLLLLSDGDVLAGGFFQHVLGSHAPFFAVLHFEGEFHVPLQSFCMIGDTKYAAGSQRGMVDGSSSDHMCQCCVPLRSTSAWSPCNEGLSCNFIFVDPPMGAGALFAEEEPRCNFGNCHASVTQVDPIFKPRDLPAVLWGGLLLEVGGDYIVGSTNQVNRIGVSGTRKVGWTALLNGNDNIGIGGIAYNQAQNTIIIVGTFDTVNGFARENVALLDADTGELIKAFNVDMTDGSTVLSVLVFQDQYLIGGSFTHINGDLDNRFLTLLDGTGSVVDGFVPPLTIYNSNVGPFAMDIDQDGGILLVGSAVMLSRTAMARLNSDLTEDTTFPTSLGITSNVRGVLSLGGDGAVISVRDALIRFDSTWGTMWSASGSFYSTIELGDGRLVAGAVDGVHIYDTTTGDEELFLASQGTVRSLMDVGDGKVLAAGGFNVLHGAEQMRLAVVNLETSSYLATQLEQGICP